MKTTLSKSFRFAQFTAFATAAFALLDPNVSVYASSQTWTGGGADGNWTTTGDWTNNTAPGAASGSTNADTATFNNSTNTTVTVDSGRNIKSILFDTGAGAFTFNGGPLTITNGGSFTINSAVTNSETFNVNLLGSPNATATAYSFINNSATAGAQLLLNGNITGQMTASTETFTFDGSNGGTVAGVISNGTGGGNVAVTKAGAGTWTLSGANTYTGTTAITAGTVKIGNASALGVSQTNLTAGATIDLNGVNLNMQYLNNGAALAGGVIDNVSAGGSVTLNVGGGSATSASSSNYTANDTFSGVIKNTTGTVSLTKVSPTGVTPGVGIMSTAKLPTGNTLLRLTNQNTYTGATTIKGGYIELNFGNANNGGATVLTNIISSSSVLTLAGGGLLGTQAASSQTSTQTFASTTLNAGASSVGFYRNTSGANTVNLAAITRNVGGTLDFGERPTGTSSNQQIAAAGGTYNTTTANGNFTTVGGSQTIIGGYATFTSDGNTSTPGLTSWAVSASNGTTSGAITALATASYSTTFTAATDVDAAIGTSTPGPLTINSLRFNNAGAYTINTAGNLAIASGGILVNPQIGANTVAINNNNLTSNNGKDLIVIQNNTNAGMTIGSNIVDSTVGSPTSIGLTKSGIGTLTLNGNNTFTGQLTINGGNLILGSSGALNSNGSTFNDVVFGGTSQDATWTSQNSSFTLANGTLSLGGNSATVASLTSSSDSSGTAIVQNTSANAATLTINGGNSKSFAGTIQDGTGGGVLSLTKTGAGTQTLTGLTTYTGATAVNGGTLIVKNSLATSGTVSIGAGATLNVSAVTGGLAIGSGQLLKGNGTLTGLATIGSNGHLAPGSSVGTLTLGSLTLSTGSLLDYEFNNTPANDFTLVSTSGGFTINGGSINLYQEGTTNIFNTNGTYNLFGYTGALGGSLSNLAVAAPSQSGGHTYTFGTTTASGTNFITLTIASNGVISNWTNTGGGSWVTNGNWDNGVPQNAGDTANFLSSITGPSTVTLDGDKTVGNVTFNNSSNSYTIAQGSSGSLIMDSGTNTAGITDTAGSHAISAPVILSGSAGNTSVLVVNSTDTLTMSGVVSGTNGITKTGAGTLLLSASNGYSGGTAINAGVVQFTTDANNFGAGGISFGGGGVKWAANNTTDLSTRTLTFNSGGATFDLNGNSITMANAIGNGGSGGLTLTGSGSLTVIAANNYSGATVISSGTLQLGDGTTGHDGTIANTSGVNIANGATLAFNRFGTVSSGYAISGSGAVTMNGSGTQILTGSNSFTGATTISGGTLQLGNASAALNSTVNVNLNNGLKFSSGVGTFNIGALNGSGNIVLSDTTGTAVTLNSGGNGASTTYSGSFTGNGALGKLGTSTLTLTGSNAYTGNTSIGAGSLTLSGGVIGGGVTQGALSLSPTNTLFTINSGTAAFTTITTNDTGNASVIVLNSGSLTASGAATISADNGASVGRWNLNGGTFSAASITQGRGAANLGSTILTTVTTGEGIQVNGASVNITNNWGIGTLNSSVNSGAIFREDSGTVTVGGTTTITNNASSRYSVMMVSGGTFSSNTIKIGGNFASPFGELLLGGTSTANGVVSANTIQFGDATQTGGSNVLEMLGGTLYVGSGGLVNSSSGGAVTPTINLGGTAFVTAPTLGASADWSSSLGMTLANSSSSVAPTIQAADAQGNAHNITLSGGIGGNTFIKTGAGTLTLNGAGNFFNGGATIQQGTLNINSVWQLGGGVYGGLTFSGSGGTLQYASTLLNGATDITQDTSDGGLGLNGVAKNVTLSANATIDTNGNNVFYKNTVGNNGAGGLTKAGAGTLTLGGSNNYTGATTVNNGTLQLGDGTSGHDGTISTTSGVSVASGATLAFNRFGTVSSSYVISGSGSVTMNGSGSQELTANNTYTGSTAVNGGKLIVSGSLSGTGAVSVAAGAELNVNGLVNTAAAVTLNGTLSGNGTVGAVTANSGATVSAGNSIGTLTTGNLVLSGSSTFVLQINTSAQTTDLVNSGTLSLDSNSPVLLTITDIGTDTALADHTKFTFLDYTGSAPTGQFSYTGTVNGNSVSNYALNEGDRITLGSNTYAFTYSDGANTAVALEVVPEPSTYAMILGGIGMLGFYNKLRRRKA